MTTQAVLAEASGTNILTVMKTVKLLRCEGLTLPLRRSPQDRYPEELKGAVRDMAGELMGLDFRRITVVMILNDLCQGAIRPGTLHAWVYGLGPKPPLKVHTCMEACREHGKRCRNRLRHSRIHFHLAKGATKSTPIEKRGAHFWDTG